jgi:fructose-1-phosphate kinase PfkB-like protein
VESVTEGPRGDPNVGTGLLTLLEKYLAEAELVILSGSLPPGLPLDLYPMMIQLAERYGVLTLADIHSQPLQNAIGAKPWLIKPNLSEFHELIGRITQNLAERIEASREFCRRTGIILALSMSDEGLLLTTLEGQWLLIPPSIEVHLPDGRGQNVIGCGDALVGALAYEYCRSKNLLEAATFGLAAAHFNLSTFGVPEIDPEQVRDLVGHVQIQNLHR